MGNNDDSATLKFFYGKTIACIWYLCLMTLSTCIYANFYEQVIFHANWTVARAMHTTVTKSKTDASVAAAVVVVTKTTAASISKDKTVFQMFEWNWLEWDRYKEKRRHKDKIPGLQRWEMKCTGRRSFVHFWRLHHTAAWERKKKKSKCMYGMFNTLQCYIWKKHIDEAHMQDSTSVTGKVAKGTMNTLSAQYGSLHCSRQSVVKVKYIERKRKKCSAKPLPIDCLCI